MFVSEAEEGLSVPMLLHQVRESVGSRAGFIYVSDIFLPSLKIIYIISVIIGLRRYPTTTFSINIEGLNGFFMFPLTFSVCAVSQACVFVLEAEGG